MGDFRIDGCGVVVLNFPSGLGESWRYSTLQHHQLSRSVRVDISSPCTFYIPYPTPTSISIPNYLLPCKCLAFWPGQFFISMQGSMSPSSLEDTWLCVWERLCIVNFNASKHFTVAYWASVTDGEHFPCVVQYPTDPSALSDLVLSPLLFSNSNYSFALLSKLYLLSYKISTSLTLSRVWPISSNLKLTLFTFPKPPHQLSENVEDRLRLPPIHLLQQMLTSSSYHRIQLRLHSFFPNFSLPWKTPSLLRLRQVHLGFVPLPQLDATACQKQNHTPYIASHPCNKVHFKTNHHFFTPLDFLYTAT